MLFLKKKNLIFSLHINLRALQVRGLNPLIFVSFFIVFSILFFVSSSLIQKKNNENSTNLKEITKNNEFSNLTNFLISKINNPYEEVSYIIKNNDTIEKILKKFEVRNEDIKKISAQLKIKKLANIYSGRKLSLIIKNLKMVKHSY